MEDQLAAAELAAVLEELGIDFELPSGPSTPDLVLASGVAVEVKATTRPTLTQLRDWEEAGLPHGTYVVIVADRIDPTTRQALEEAGYGWLDRRGYLRLLTGSVQIDRAIPSLAGPDPSIRSPLTRPTTLAVALALLEEEDSVPMRELASRASVSVGATHAAIEALESEGLLVDGRRRDPELFWAVAAQWRTRWFGLSRGPFPDIPEPTRRLLRMGFFDAEAPGWAQVGDEAARAYGARVVGDEPPRLYVPDQRALTWALRSWGEAGSEGSARAFLAVAPARNAVAPRVDPHSPPSSVGGQTIHVRPTNREWLLARPIVAALQLASEGGPRSREILETWDPSTVGFNRVW